MKISQRASMRWMRRPATTMATIVPMPRGAITMPVVITG